MAKLSPRRKMIEMTGGIYRRQPPASAGLESSSHCASLYNVIACGTSPSSGEPVQPEKNHLNLPRLPTISRRRYNGAKLVVIVVSEEGRASSEPGILPGILQGFLGPGEALLSSPATTTIGYTPFDRPSGGRGRRREVQLVLLWMFRLTRGRRCIKSDHVLQTGATRGFQARVM